MSSWRRQGPSVHRLPSLSLLPLRLPPSDEVSTLRSEPLGQPRGGDSPASPRSGQQTPTSIDGGNRDESSQATDGTPTLASCIHDLGHEDGSQRLPHVLRSKSSPAGRGLFRLQAVCAEAEISGRDRCKRSGSSSKTPGAVVTPVGSADPPGSPDPRPAPRHASSCYPAPIPKLVEEPLVPPRNVLEALEAVSPGEATRPAVGRHPGVRSSPILNLGSATASPVASALDSSEGRSSGSSALPSPDYLEQDPAVMSKRPSIRKRRSWKGLPSRTRSISFDALHGSFSNLSVLSSFKSLTGSRKDGQGRTAKTQQQSASSDGPEAAFEGITGEEGMLQPECGSTYDSTGLHHKQPAAARYGVRKEAPPSMSAHSRIQDEANTHAPCKLYNPEDPALQEWSRFVQAYASGQMDLSVPPHIPCKGKPDTSMAPNCLGLGEGPLLAPRPAWEGERQRTLDRYRLEEMPEERWEAIQGICHELQRQTQCMETIFATIESDAMHLWCNSNGVYPAGRYSRSHTMCAHTILNRNQGLVVADLHKDWRWSRNPLLEGLRFYAAMPVCASDSLPIGTLCCLDAQPRTDDDECHRNLLREMAAAISSELEAWSVECFRRKVEAIEKGWKKLELYLNRPDEVQLGEPIAQPPDLLAASREPHSSPVDLREVASLGLEVTWSDISHVNYCASLIAEAVGFETVYVAAVTSPEHCCTLIGSHGLTGPLTNLEAGVHLQALHSRDGGLIYEDRGRLGRSQSAEKVPIARYHAGILCPVYFRIPEAPDASVRGSDLSTILETRPARSSQDTIAPAAWRTSVVSTAAYPSIGFVLVALTKSRRRVVGIEDLRYLQGFADVIGALWRKCLPSAAAPGIEATEEAAKIAMERAEELSRKARQPSYIAAGKKAMRATGEGLSALMKGMHLHGSKSSMDLGVEIGKRPELHRQQTLGSLEGHDFTEGEPSMEAEWGLKPRQTWSYPKRSLDRTQTASSSRSSSGSDIFGAKSAETSDIALVRKAWPAPVEMAASEESAHFPGMGAPPARGLQPCPRRTRARTSCS
ncbi:hypothetical protein ACQY0O_001011 [Thecaphora frezii]